MSCAYFTEFASFANFWATARGLINTLAYFGLGRLVAALFGRDSSRPCSLSGRQLQRPGRQAAAGESGDQRGPGAAAAPGCHVAAPPS